MTTTDETSAMTLVHRLRAITVEPDLLGAEFARRHGLHPTDLRALIHLLDTSSVTALVGRLVDAGHVRRYRDPADGRRVLLDVDERAVALGRSFFGPLIADLVGVLSPFAQSELDAVGRVLDAAVETIGRQRPERGGGRPS